MFNFYMCIGAELPESSKGIAYLSISWTAQVLIAHTWILDSCWSWNQHTYCTYITQNKSTQKSLGVLSWLLKMMSENGLLLLLTVGQITPGCLFLPKATWWYTCFEGNLNYFLATILLQERPYCPSSNDRNITTAAVDQLKYLFLFVISIRFTYISQKPYLVKSAANETIVVYFLYAVFFIYYTEKSNWQRADTTKRMQQQRR